MAQLPSLVHTQIELVKSSQTAAKGGAGDRGVGARIQVYDAPFGLRKADSFTLHVNGQPSYVRGQAAQPLFDDTEKYFYDEIPWAGVKLPAVGVKIKVVEQSGTSLKVKFS